MVKTSFKARIIFWLAITMVVTGAVAAALFISSTPTHQVQAAAAPARYEGLITAGTIYTDNYETNNDAAVAYNLDAVTLTPCTIVVHDATFYYVAGLLNPANDTDWYKVNLGAQIIYTMTIEQSTASDLQFIALLQDPVNSVIASANAQSTAVFTFYSLSGGTYKLKLNAYNASTISATEGKTYQITLCSSATNITPTPPNNPTSTPSSLTPDAYAPNDTLTEAADPTPLRGLGTASFIAAGSRIDNLNFAPFTSRPAKTTSWFEFYGRSGSIYQATTLNVAAGVETVISIYKPVANTVTPDLVLVAPIGGFSNPNNRYQAGARGSQTSFQVPSGADGLYWIQVTNVDPSPRVSGQNYSLQVIEILQAVTPGPSPTPTALPPTSTPFPGTPDRYEYNGDFDHAALIAPNVMYDNLNFVPSQPLSPNDTDNDYFRLPVKQGIYYTCQSLTLAPGVDTNIIIYNQDRVGIGGNDDISPEERAKGNFASRFSWLASYTGSAYILVGEVNPPRANEAGSHTYSLRCDIGLPMTPTPTATPFGTPPPSAIPAPATYAPPTPVPPEPTMTPFPTPRSAQNLPVRQINASTPTPVPQPTATPRVVALNVQIFNDVNRNGLLDAGEGIQSVSVRLVDEESGTPLALTLTDADGRVNFSVSNPGSVRLSIPLFGYSALINNPSTTVRIAVVTEVTLPDRIP